MLGNEKYVVPEAAPKDRPFMFVVKTVNEDIAEFAKAIASSTFSTTILAAMGS